MSSEVTQAKSVEATGDGDDHGIKLIDSTAAANEDAPQLATQGSWRGLVRNATRTSVKEQLSRRKYASWRKDRFDAADRAGNRTPEQTVEQRQVVAEAHPDNEESQTVDFGRRPDTADGDRTSHPAKHHHKKHKDLKPETEVDILYENQRGSFFCGIPLYSHSSLLNFDPASWVTRDFKNSPVNITNAQVPDPSWVWAWKTWYVDMSDDVDEEGWQYSFSFGNKFAWHGSHPWFHSFVRRRRWLRKRVKRADAVRKDKEGSMEAAHHLNTDYFTIHSRTRDRSPVSLTNPEAQLARPISYTSARSVDEELAKPEEIASIPDLMKAIRIAAVDREKIDAIKAFVTNGGDEVHYLAEQIPEIVSRLVFQNSRRQILEYLRSEAEAAQHHRDEHDAENRPEGEAETRHIDDLLRAADAVNKEISGLEYWSDRKHVLQTEDETEEDEDEDESQVKDVLGEIRGISEKAETSSEIRVDRRLISKGKKPAQEEQQADAKDTEKQHPSLGHDDVLIPDEDSSHTLGDEGSWKGQDTKPVELDM